MLSNEAANWLAWISLAGILVSVLVMFGLYEAGYTGNYYENLGTKIASGLRGILLVTFMATLVYSIVSLYHNEATERENTVSNIPKEKYSIELTKDQQDDLFKNLPDSQKDFQSSGHTEINNQEIIAIWHGKELFLYTYVDGQLKELPKQ